MSSTEMDLVATRESPTHKVTFIPWDPDSTEHVRRLYDQRVSAGFRQELVEKWAVRQREGKMTIRWILLSEDDPTKESMLAMHTTRYPNQKTPITDSATFFGGQPRQPPPSRPHFIPVGHISLDSQNLLDPELGDGSRGIYCITTFYISDVLQRNGLGRAAMDAIEMAAVNHPCFAKVLTLDTLPKENHMDPSFWEAMGKPMPPISNQEWYARRGYQIFKRIETSEVWTDKMGKVRHFNTVLMKKSI